MGVRSIVPSPLARAGHRLAAAFLATALIACGSSGDDGAPGADAGSQADAETFDYPPPRTDLVDSVGTPGAIDIATWNIEEFPYVQQTPQLMADLIASLDLDLIAVQEISNLAGWDELIERLRGYSGVLSTHTYGNGSFQKVGFIYRTELLDVTGAFLLFDSNGYEFPRPPMQVRVAVKDGSAEPFDFLAISLHLKAGQDPESRSRRITAMQILETHLRQNVDGTGDDDVVVLGDFNQTLDNTEDQAVYAPITAAPDRYDIRTEPLVANDEVSHLGTSRLIDHIISTAALRDDISGNPVIPRLDDQMTNYFFDVSDHLPVIVTIPLP